MTIVNVTRSTTIAHHIDIAASFWGRAKGLIGRAGLPADYALVLHPCNGVHAFFLTFALDVIYLDRDDCVLRVVCLHPWHVGPMVKQSRTVIELLAGAVTRTGTMVGDLITWRELSDAGAQDSAPCYPPGYSKEADRFT